MSKVDLTVVAQLPEFKERVRELALQYGFKLKVQPDGTEDLNPYVYEFAYALVYETVNNEPLNP